MGLRLRFLSFWTPEWFLNKGLDELAHSTIEGLEVILDHKSKSNIPRNGSNTLKRSNTLNTLKGSNPLKGSNIILKGNLHERRKIMATMHNQLVETMINTLGRDEAMKLGREAMFSEGLYLGQKFRKMLGVGNSTEDLITAANILYEILGIEFTIKETKNNEMIMVVNHCSLAEYYTRETCQVLSAADEGVVQGLNPNIRMNFTERITQGAPCCIASIQLEGVN